MYRQGSPEIVAQILGLRLPDLRELGIRHGRRTCGGRSISGVALSLNALDGRARRREWRTTRAAGKSLEKVIERDSGLGSGRRMREPWLSPRT